MGLFSQRMANPRTENAFKVGSDIRKVEESGLDVVKLNLGEPDDDSSDNINKIAIEHIKAGNSHY